jgi:hypothetical protein
MDTISGEGASVFMRHAAPASCIQGAMFDAMETIRSERKSDRLSGCQGLTAVRGATASDARWVLRVHTSAPLRQAARHRICSRSAMRGRRPP